MHHHLHESLEITILLICFSKGSFHREFHYALLSRLINNLIIFDELEAVVHVLLQAHSGEGKALVNLVADAGDVSALVYEFGGGMVGGGACGGILKAAGISADGGEEAVGNLRGDGPTGLLEKLVDQFSGGG